MRASVARALLVVPFINRDVLYFSRLRLFGHRSMIRRIVEPLPLLSALFTKAPTTTKAIVKVLS